MKRHAHHFQLAAAAVKVADWPAFTVLASGLVVMLMVVEVLMPMYWESGVPAGVGSGVGSGSGVASSMSGSAGCGSSGTTTSGPLVASTMSGSGVGSGVTSGAAGCVVFSVSSVLSSVRVELSCSVRSFTSALALRRRTNRSPAIAARMTARITSPITRPLPLRGSSS